MNFGIEGKNALVCAASRGLGRAVAEALVCEGVNVGICARDAMDVATTVQALSEYGAGSAWGQAADVGDTNSVDGLLAAFCQAHGSSPDIVVWNAGGPPAGPLLELPETALEDGISLHLIGAMHLFRSTIPAMSARGWGRVVAVTSVAVRQPLRNLGVSNGVRAGLHGLLKTLALEVGGTGVTVNAALPGYTQTERLEALANTIAGREGRTPDDVLSTFADTVPAGRLGTPEEFGAAVAFLCSGQASYINGVSLPVDGGFCQGLL